MKTYFFDHTANSLSTSFTHVYNVLSKILPNFSNYYSNFNYDYRFQRPITEFVRLIAELERLNFMDDLTKVNTKTAVLYKKGKHLDEFISRNLDQMATKTSFTLIEDASTHYQPSFPIRRMPALEAKFKLTPRHFLIIGTYKTEFIVYTNKPLPFETILKLKRVQYNLFKDRFKTLKPEIEEFLTALSEKKSVDTLNTLIDKLLNSEELQSIRYDELKELFKPNFEYQLEDLTNKKIDLERNCLDYENRLSAMVTEINKINDDIILVQTKINNSNYDATPLIKYMLKHPYIKEFDKYDNNRIRLRFESPVVYFDPYLIDKIYHNKSTNQQKILRAFKANEYELMTRCEILFDTKTFSVRFNSIGNNDVIGHPHIDRFNCFGNHHIAIRESAKTGDYLGAIEQISQATLNVNFSDATVIDYMLRTLRDFSYLKTWRSKETGAMLTTDEIMEIYNEET